MMKKFIVSLLIFVMFQQSFPVHVGAFSWYSHATLKITVETLDSIYEWEYENPNSFEYEAGDRIVRGNEAKESFERILHYFDLTSSSINTDTMKKLEEDMKIHILKVVVRRRDRNYKLQTWSWTKEE